jgi:hypothetical protein
MNSTRCGFDDFMNAGCLADLARLNLSFGEAFALGSAHALDNRRLEVLPHIDLDGVSVRRLRKEPKA